MQCRKIRLQINAGVRTAFTLIELLVVVAVIGILAALILPGLSTNHTEKLGETIAYLINLINFGRKDTL